MNVHASFLHAFSRVKFEAMADFVSGWFPVGTRSDEARMVAVGRILLTRRRQFIHFAVVTVFIQQEFIPT